MMYSFIKQAKNPSQKMNTHLKRTTVSSYFLSYLSSHDPYTYFLTLWKGPTLTFNPF